MVPGEAEDATPIFLSVTADVRSILSLKVLASNPASA